MARTSRQTVIPSAEITDDDKLIGLQGGTAATGSTQEFTLSDLRTYFQTTGSASSISTVSINRTGGDTGTVSNGTLTLNMAAIPAPFSSTNLTGYVRSSNFVVNGNTLTLPSTVAGETRTYTPSASSLEVAQPTASAVTANSNLSKFTTSVISRTGAYNLPTGANLEDGDWVKIVNLTGAAGTSLRSGANEPFMGGPLNDNILELDDHTSSFELVWINRNTAGGALIGWVVIGAN